MSFSFYVLSDTHLYSETLGTRGDAYARDNQKSQKLLAGSRSVIHDVFDRLLADGSIDTVLISGDLVNNGEMSSHQEMLAELTRLQTGGKKVYALTATHDYDGAHRYEGNEKIPTNGAKRTDLWEMYFPFGPDKALSVHRESHSYTAQLAPGYRLLALNDDKDGSGHSGFSPDCLAWILEEIRKGKQDRQFLIAMTHHPMISPSVFYSLIGKNDLMHGREAFIQAFLSAGLPFIFTGHTHMQDIARSHRFYDISTPSLVGYPGTWRVCTADRQSNTIAVQTQQVPPEALQAMEQQFFGMIRDVVKYAAADNDRFAEMGRAFSLRPEFSRKHKHFITFCGKILRLMRVDEIVVAVVRRLYGGNPRRDYRRTLHFKV
ncbi:MAG: metallophosphoesterase [Oscillospiraceae bacterium]|jgi:hypothetical protein|nr:metallophosphoesterase [Oscillospiraceae bacterium]